MKAISLFSGAGGCSLGLRQAGIDVVLAVDVDKAACDTYEANLDGNRVWCTDLSETSGTGILTQSTIADETVDLVVGGPPCQGFSSAGARNWHDPRNRLLRKFVELVIQIKPTWFIMENVEGLLTANEGYYFIEAVARFLEAGYWVKAEKVYMEEHGLPQRRKRVFLVGNLEEIAFDFPTPTYQSQMQMSFLADAYQLNILDAIDDLPEPFDAPRSMVETVIYEEPPRCDYQSRLRGTDGAPIFHHVLRKTNDTTQQRIQLLAQGETMKVLPTELQHPSFSKRAFRRVMDGTPTEKRGGAPSGLKRLLASEPSLTITSASPSEFIHPIENRLLTLRECARIQSFPDDFRFYGSWTSIATQIGNAIPPLFMSKLARQILSLSSGSRVPTSSGRWLGIQATRSNGISPALGNMLVKLEEYTNAYAR